MCGPGLVGGPELVGASFNVEAEVVVECFDAWFCSFAAAAGPLVVGYSRSVVEAAVALSAAKLVLVEPRLLYHGGATCWGWLSSLVKAYAELLLATSVHIESSSNCCIGCREYWLCCRESACSAVLSSTGLPCSEADVAPRLGYSLLELLSSAARISLLRCAGLECRASFYRLAREAMLWIEEGRRLEKLPQACASRLWGVLSGDPGAARVCAEELMRVRVGGQAPS